MANIMLKHLRKSFLISVPLSSIQIGFAYVKDTDRFLLLICYLCVQFVKHTNVTNSRSLSPLEIFQMYVLLHTLASIQMSEALFTPFFYGVCVSTHITMITRAARLNGNHSESVCSNSSWFESHRFVR